MFLTSPHLCAQVVFAVGGVTLCAAQDYPTLLAGRVVVGFAVSLSAIAEVIYITEIAPPSRRGQLVRTHLPYQQARGSMALPPAQLISRIEAQSAFIAVKCLYGRRCTLHVPPPKFAKDGATHSRPV